MYVTYDGSDTMDFIYFFLNVDKGGYGRGCENGEYVHMEELNGSKKKYLQIVR